jgi:hypothetical protein
MSDTEEAPSVNTPDYYRGFYDGFKAAQKAQDYPKIYPTQPLGPIRTEDIMWPDRIPTTTPFPSSHYNACTLCRIDLNKATHYVCHHPTCPTQIKVTC